MTTTESSFGFDDYEEALRTPHGSTVANVMLRQLREAMGLSNGAMPIRPQELWERTLAGIQDARGGYRDALRAIVRLADQDEKAYIFDPSFHAAVEIASRALDQIR